MKAEKSNSFNNLAFKSGTIYMVSNLVISSLSIITAPIFTRLLTTQDYGIAANFASWVNISLVIVGLGLSYTIGNAKIDFPDNLDFFLASIQSLSSLFGIVILIFVIVFVDSISHFMGIESNLVILIFVYLLFLPSVIYSQEKYKYQLKYKENIFMTLFGSIGAILFCLILINFLSEKKYVGRIIGLILPFLLMGIFFYIKILISGWKKHITKYWEYALKISVPMIPHALAMLILTQMDRIMIVKYCGNSDAGLFSFGYTYAVLLLLLSNSVLQAFQPWLYSKYNDDKLLEIKVATNYITLGMCIVTISIVTVAPEALMILGSKAFWPSKYIVMPIAVGALLQYLYNIYASLELYHKKTIVIAIGTFIAAIINFTLNTVFIPTYGYKAAAYVTLISYFSLALFHLIAHRKITQKSVFSNFFIWSIILFTGLLCFLISILYEYYLIRYSLLLIIIFSILITFYFNKKKLSDLSAIFLT